MLIKRAVFGVLGLLFLALPLFTSLPAQASAATTCPTLARGSTGAAVTTLQKFLTKEYTNFTMVTGYFGSVTEAAVKQWQKEHGIAQTGGIGPKTRAAMKLSCTPLDTRSDLTEQAPTTTSAKAALIQALLAQVKILQDKIAALLAASTTVPVATTTPPIEDGRTPPQLASCTFNGQTVNNGASVTAYQSTTVPFGQTCVSQIRSCTNGALSGFHTSSSCAVAPAPLSTALVKYVGIVDNSSWLFHNNRIWTAPKWDTYMQSITSDFNANMVVLNIVPPVFYDNGQTYPNVTAEGVGQIIRYLQAAQRAGLKVYVVIAANCVYSDATFLAGWHDPGSVPLGESPWWPKCPADRTARNKETDLEPQFAMQTGEWFYRVISQVEQSAQSAGVLDTIVAWAPQGDVQLGSAETRVDRNDYVPDIGDLTRVGWPRNGAGANTYSNGSFNPARPLTSFMIFGFPMPLPPGVLPWIDAAGAYGNLKRIFNNLWWVPHPFDYLQITYHSGYTDIDSAIQAASDFGLDSSKVVLTDFGSAPDFVAAESDVRKLRPDIVWLWKRDNVATSTYKSFIEKLRGQ